MRKENNMPLLELVDENKISKKINKKTKKWTKEEKDLQKYLTNNENKAISAGRVDFFPWLAEEIRKMRAEDDFVM